MPADERRNLTDLGLALDQNRCYRQHPIDEAADRSCAVYAIAARARDAEEARELLDMLGLDPDGDTA